MLRLAGVAAADAGTTAPPSPVRDALARHGVALVSLFIALSGLAYNTWRNETTEAHRNVRQAAFVVFEQLGQLQQIVDQRFYAGRQTPVNRIAGWGKVTLVRDIGMLVTPATSRKAGQLFATWQSQLDAMDAGNPSAEREISHAIAAVREQVLRDLESLQ